MSPGCRFRIFLNFSMKDAPKNAKLMGWDYQKSFFEIWNESNVVLNKRGGRYNSTPLLAFRTTFSAPFQTVCVLCRRTVSHESARYILGLEREQNNHEWRALIINKI